MKGFNPADMPLVIAGTPEEIARVADWVRQMRASYSEHLRSMHMMIVHDDIDAGLMLGLEEQRTRDGMSPRARVIQLEGECEFFCDYAMALGKRNRHRIPGVTA